MNQELDSLRAKAYELMYEIQERDVIENEIHSLEVDGVSTMRGDFFNLKPKNIVDSVIAMVNRYNLASYFIVFEDIVFIQTADIDEMLSASIEINEELFDKARENARMIAVRKRAKGCKTLGICYIDKELGSVILTCDYVRKGEKNYFFKIKERKSQSLYNPLNVWSPIIIGDGEMK